MLFATVSVWRRTAHALVLDLVVLHQPLVPLPLSEVRVEVRVLVLLQILLLRLDLREGDAAPKELDGRHGALVVLPLARSASS